MTKETAESCKSWISPENPFFYLLRVISFKVTVEVQRLFKRTVTCLK